jgi:hypothetical protein
MVAAPLGVRETEKRAREAELFVAKRYGLEAPALLGVDKGFDFRLENRRDRKCRPLTIDVKWSSGEYLNVRSSEKGLRAMAYLLVTGEPGAFEIRGFAWKHRVASSIRDVGKGPFHSVPIEKLLPAEILFASQGVVVA